MLGPALNNDLWAMDQKATLERENIWADAGYLHNRLSKSDCCLTNMSADECQERERTCRKAGEGFQRDLRKVRVSPANKSFSGGGATKKSAVTKVDSSMTDLDTTLPLCDSCRWLLASNQREQSDQQ